MVGNICEDSDGRGEGASFTADLLVIVGQKRRENGSRIAEWRISRAIS